MNKKNNFLAEFREFIARGNVLDMAVGIIMGSAFTAVVTALVNNVIMPFISLVLGGIDFSMWNLRLGRSADAPVLAFGLFFAAIINFLLIALVLFFIIRAINRMREKKGKEEAAPTTKTCPYCKSEIPLQAVRCPHCTSSLEEDSAGRD